MILSIGQTVRGPDGSDVVTDLIVRTSEGDHYFPVGDKKNIIRVLEDLLVKAKELRYD